MPRSKLFKMRKLCRNDEVQYSICCNDNLSQIEKWLIIGWHALQQPQACALRSVAPWPYEPQLLQGRMGLEDTLSGEILHLPELSGCFVRRPAKLSTMLKVTPIIAPPIIHELCWRRQQACMWAALTAFQHPRSSVTALSDACTH